MLKRLQNAEANAAATMLWFIIMWPASTFSICFRMYVLLLANFVFSVFCPIWHFCLEPILYFLLCVLSASLYCMVFTCFFIWVWYGFLSCPHYAVILASRSAPYLSVSACCFGIWLQELCGFIWGCGSWPLIGLRRVMNRLSQSLSVLHICVSCVLHNHLCICEYIRSLQGQWQL